MNPQLSRRRAILLAALTACLSFSLLLHTPAHAQQPDPADQAPAAQPAAEAQPAPTELADQAGYAVGVTIGHSIRARLNSAPFPLSHDAIVEGIRDSLSGATLRLTEQQMQAAMSAIAQAAAPDQSGRAEAERRGMEQARASIERARARDREMANQREREQAIRAQLPARQPTPAERLAADTVADPRQAEADPARRDAANHSRLFLLANAQRPGVVSRPSGLQYRILTPGDGPSPTPTDRVTAHYVGKRIDGSVFESSRDSATPLTFTLDQVIDGWAEALPLMKQGARWELYLPASLAFGERGRGEKVKPNEAVVFEIELLNIEPAPTPQPAADAPAKDSAATTKTTPTPAP